MNEKRFERLKRLFEEALELSEEQRSAFLDTECPEDPGLRSEVERLLSDPTGSEEIERLEREAHEALASTRLAETATERAPSTSDKARCIGPYRLLEKIGEGGMGEVWVAEQTEPVRRRVALKVIKRGMDTDQVVARFEAERQALAMMDHPAIARVFDAGQTPEGRPYFVMEHVEGVPITEHCDRHRLTTRERLELFVNICKGVQHAHQKAVIHRDLKPSNVLVTIKDGVAAPKIIDFGVAKATAQRLTEKTVYTELGVLIGTPEYMSPEQAEMTGQNVDTRTDVYSLGVLLYELLTGVLPFDARELRASGFDEIRRRIREVDPPRPSTRLRSMPGDRSTPTAQNRRTEPRRLSSQLRGDLDWITMKALEKDRARRYGSPNELSADVERYLTDRPVEAGRPSAVYRARKFVRRNRALVLGGAAVLAVLLAGVAVSAWFGVSEARARAEAERSREDLERVVAFQAEMLNRVDPETAGAKLMAHLRERIAEARRRAGDSDSARDGAVASFNGAVAGVNATDLARWVLDENILSPAGETVETEFEQRPRIEARLRHTIGGTYRALGLLEPAEEHLVRALDLRRSTLGDQHPDTLVSLCRLGSFRHDQGDHDNAEILFEECHETSQRVLGKAHPETLRRASARAENWKHLRRYDDAERVQLELLEASRRSLGDEHEVTLEITAHLSQLYRDQGKIDKAEPLMMQLVESRRRVLGEEHPKTLNSISNLAIVYLDFGRNAEAEALYREELAVLRRVNGNEHASTLSSIHNLAEACLQQGEYEEAEALEREALEGRRRLFGDDHAATLVSRRALALNYLSRGESERGEQELRAVIDDQRRVLGADDPGTLVSMARLARVHERRRRFGEAETLTREILASRRRGLGEDHGVTLATLDQLGMNVYQQGRIAEAGEIFAEALEGRRRSLGDRNPATALSMNRLGAIHEMQGHHEQSEQLFREAIEAYRQSVGPEDSRTLVPMSNLGIALRKLGRYDESEAVHRETLEIRRRVLREDHPDTLVSAKELAWVLLIREPLDRAKLGEAFDLALEANEKTDYEKPAFLSTLAHAYFVKGEAERAVEMQRKALGLLGEDVDQTEYRERLSQYEAALEGC